jgi:hypothetical protein
MGMPLVFVHGVNNRPDQAFFNDQKVRDAYFRDIALKDFVAKPAQFAIENPIWGDKAARFAFHHAALPTDQFESFGSSGDPFEEILAEMAPGEIDDPGRVLLNLARRSMVQAVDTLWATAAYTRPLGPQSMAPQLVGQALKALHYARKDLQRPWLNQVKDDKEFVVKLLEEIDAFSDSAAPAESAEGELESFGASDLFNHMKSSVARLEQAARNAVQSTASAFSRMRDSMADAMLSAADQIKQAAGAAAQKAALNAAESFLAQLVPAHRADAHYRLANFLGDIFVYLDRRGRKGQEGTIEQIVGDAFTRAAAARTDDDKLIIVGHSMGGNIAYDVLTYFRPEIQCDVFLTVGSQVGFFEELKLYRASDPSIPNDRQPLVPMPANIKRWVNVFDPIDVLGYSTSKIFQGSEDFAFSTDSGVFSAHGMYFYRIHFHERLNAHLKPVGPPP